MVDVRSDLVNQIGIVIPAYNEAATITRVVKECLRTSAMVCVVSDGSTDNTAELARDAGATLICNSSKCGQGASLLRGIKYFVQLGHRHIASVDGDGAHDPNDLREMLQKHVSNSAQLTLGSRLLHWDAYEFPSSKAAANQLVSSLLNSLFGTGVSDPACGIRIYDATFAEFEHAAVDFSFAFDTLMWAREKKFEIAESAVHVRYDAREHFFTSKQEMLDLLNLFLRRLGSENDAYESVLAVRDAVKLDERLLLNCEGQEFALLPIAPQNAYVVQLQNPWYARTHRHGTGQFSAECF